MVELPKGGNTSLGGTVVRSSLRTALAPGDVEICALLVDQQRRARSDADFVFFNQEKSGCGSTRRLSPIEIEVDLTKVPAAVHAIVVVATLDDGVTGSFAEHGHGGVRIVGASTITHTFSGLSTERCVIAAEIYRRNHDWKVRAVSQGFPDLARLIAVFGVDAEEKPPAPVPASGPAGESSADSCVPPETGEIVDRVREGVAVRRGDTTARPRVASWRSNPLLRTSSKPATQPLTAYRAQRRAEAQQITADLGQQTEGLEHVLRQLPFRDLSTPSLLDLVDASAAQRRSPHVRLFRRTGQPPPAPPSTHLTVPLRRLRAAASSATNRDAVHAWFWISLHAMDLQPSFGHPEHVSVATDSSKVVLDVSLPDRTIFLPAHARAVYTPGNDTIQFQPMKPKEQKRLADILFSASLLAHAHAAASATASAGLPDTFPLVVNGWEAAINPATGRRDRLCRATLITDARRLGQTDLGAVDPATCLRSFAGSLDESGQVTPIATRSGTSPTGRRLDLTTINPFEFERLITDLAQAMGYAAYQTQPSHDHGVDVYVESRDTLAGGRIVISAKRYNRVVGPDHVRALDSVVGDQGAIKGILITTSHFGPESYRIAQNKPLELVDGEKLREWLREYLGIEGH